MYSRQPKTVYLTWIRIDNFKQGKSQSGANISGRITESRNQARRTKKGGIESHPLEYEA